MLGRAIAFEHQPIVLGFSYRVPFSGEKKLLNGKRHHQSQSTKWVTNRIYYRDLEIAPTHCKVQLKYRMSRKTGTPVYGKHYL